MHHLFFLRVFSVSQLFCLFTTRRHSRRDNAKPTKRLKSRNAASSAKSQILLVIALSFDFRQRDVSSLLAYAMCARRRRDADFGFLPSCLSSTLQPFQAASVSHVRRSRSFAWVVTRRSIAPSRQKESSNPMS